MEELIINGEIHHIEEKQVKFGDLIYDKNKKISYIASNWDIDDVLWIVID